MPLIIGLYGTDLYRTIYWIVCADLYVTNIGLCVTDLYATNYWIVCDGFVWQ